VAVATRAGQATLRLPGSRCGGITSRETYAHFHLRLEYRLSAAEPGAHKPAAQHAALVYGSTRAVESSSQTWSGVECGLSPRAAGGARLLPGIRAEVSAKRAARPTASVRYWPGARLLSLHGGAVVLPARKALPREGWNQLEILSWGGYAVHRLNGQVATVLVLPRLSHGDPPLPWLSGQIQFRCGDDELLVRDAEIRRLHAMPAELLDELPSPAGAETGFIPLFSPRNLAHWRQCGPGHFVVGDGVATGEGGMGLWWFAGRPFTNFVLRGEFVQEQPLADSGVFLRFPDPGNDPWNAVRLGHEVEFGDPNPEIATWRTGSIYPFQASLLAHTRPWGQWNEYEIVCLGHHYSVRMNGRLITTWTDYTARSLAGFVGLQNYPDQKTVRHRKLRIRDWPPPSARPIPGRRTGVSADASRLGPIGLAAFTNIAEVPSLREGVETRQVAGLRLRPGKLNSVLWTSPGSP
jgi:hypothetical protein